MGNALGTGQMAKCINAGMHECTNGRRHESRKGTKQKRTNAEMHECRHARTGQRRNARTQERRDAEMLNGTARGRDNRLVTCAARACCALLLQCCLVVTISSSAAAAERFALIVTGASGGPQYPRNTTSGGLSSCSSCRGSSDIRRIMSWFSRKRSLPELQKATRDNVPAAIAQATAARGEGRCGYHRTDRPWYDADSGERSSIWSGPTSAPASGADLLKPAAGPARLHQHGDAAAFRSCASSPPGAVC